MMRQVLGIIYTAKDDFSLRELTTQRAVAALPVAGRYRMIDFLLASMVNSGMRKVGVITQRNYQSLMDHLGSGQEWDLHTRNNGGLFILPPFTTRENDGEYDGVLGAIHSNVDFLRRSTQEYVILCGAHTAFNTTFNEMYTEHIKSGADITMMYTRDTSKLEKSGSNSQEHVYCDVAEDGTISNMEVNPNVPTANCFAMDCIIIKRTLLMHLVDMAHAHGQANLFGDLIRPSLDNGMLKIRGYEFKGYQRRVETVKGFYKLNMDMLDTNIRKEMLASNPVYTKVRDEVPAKYANTAEVKNSLIADGCVIEGTVENSILFRGVRVDKGAVIRNAIIMQDSVIEEGVQIENVIFDKDVTIRKYGKLTGHEQYPVVIGKGVTL